MIENASVAFPYNDYVQSANILFHFMSKITFLMTILRERKIVPRYCNENIEYLNINIEGQTFREIAVLQKCFCDIPFHKLTDTFALNGVGEGFESLIDDEKFELEKNNSHPFAGRVSLSIPQTCYLMQLLKRMKTA